MARVGVRSALLAAFLVASGAPLASFWFWPHNSAVEHEMAAVRERHLLLAQNLAAALENYGGDVRAVFSAVAPLVARGEPVEFARGLLRKLGFRHVCVADRESGAVTRAFLAEEAACPPRVPPDRLAMFRAMTEGGAVRLSGVKTPPDGGPPRLFIAAAVGESLVVGAIGGGYFRELADQVSFGRGGHAAIFDATGRALAHPRADWTAEARDFSALEPVRRALAGETGVAKFLSPALGEMAVAGFAPTPGEGWAVMVPQPMSELVERADRVVGSAILVMAAGLVLSAAIALAFSSLAARSIGQVSAAALRMAAGEQGVRVPAAGMRLAVAEFADLARSFNTMAGRIDHAQEHVAALARFDGLTGLQNRTAFFEAAEALLADPEAAGRGVALFFVDVDRFKLINDSYGHAVGDEVLRRLALRLRRAAGGDDLIARHSGDEFVLLHRKRRENSCGAVGGRLLRAMAEPVAVGDRRIAVTVSIGVATFPRDGRTLDALLLCADQAMYRAKEQGRNGLRHFDAALRRRLDEDMALTRALQAALDADALAVAYQPVVCARDGRLAGFEALARWGGDPDGPAPERFIAIAEATGLIGVLGRQVRRRAFAFAAALRAAGVAVPVSVNVSQRELAQRGFAEEFAAMLAAAGAPPEAVIVEITEGLFHEHGPAELAALKALRAAGIGLALDDFGKGFSSHGRLRSFPVNRLKIDLAFVGDVIGDPQARAVAKSLVKLGRSLDLTVTAEGVETAAERDLMVRLGADELQGFFHHAPLDEDAAMALALRDAAFSPRARAG